MKIRTLFFTLAFLLTAMSGLFAKEISKEQARLVAKNFLIERINCNQLNMDAADVLLSDIHTFEIEGKPAIYVFSNNNSGFILIAADDAITPVLGYSDNSSFSAPGTNPNFSGLLADYIDQVKFVRNNNMEATSDVAELWENFSSSTPSRTVTADTTTVGPLITTMWNQDSPYNEFCPEDPAGPGGHVYAGCVATAMSIIMNYYKYPITGSGQHSYYASGYGTQTANYGNTTYDWDAMQNTVNSSSGQGIPANALLQYHAGISVNMQYAPDGSGAYSTDVPYALKTYFKYSSAVQYVARSGYTVTNWENMLSEQLEAFKPIYYSGQSSDGGHAWVCDGYQKIGTSKMFHFNFGWGGADNGYYTSSNPNGFTTQQAIVRNITPGSNYPYGCSAKTLETSRGSFEDGSGPLALYGSGQNCSWLISPVDTVNSITVSFVRFDVNASDFLNIYDGADASAPLLASLNGNSIPPSVTSTGNKMYLEFVTDGTVQDSGWLIEYSSALPVLCSGTKTFTTPTGSFSDGSGDYDYKNNTLCKYKIQPEYALNLTLTFDELELMEEDNILVYSLLTSDLLATITGNQIPDPITVPLGGLYIIFQANSYYTGAGFTASYTVGNVGTKELTGMKALNISPNPATDFILLRAVNSKNQQVQLTISDMAGKTLYQESFFAESGSIEKSIDVTNLNAGMYFLNLKNNECSVTEKIIVR